jgi:hypothetical protein
MRNQADQKMKFYTANQFVQKPASELVEGDQIGFHTGRGNLDEYVVLEVCHVDYSGSNIVYYHNMYWSKTPPALVVSGSNNYITHASFDVNDMHIMIKSVRMRHELIMVLSQWK